MSERTEVQAPILDYCAKSGIFVERRNVAGAQKLHGHWVKLGTKGQSDLWGILRNGRHFECEVKAKGEEPTGEQLEWLRKCAAAGALAFWCDSLEDFIEVMEGR